MSSIKSNKAGYPAVYVDEHIPSPVANKSRTRHATSVIVKGVAGVLFLGCILVLIYQVIHDKQSYDSLFQKYTALQDEMASVPQTKNGHLVRRADADDMSSSSVSYIYTTTTQTEATTITIKKTSSSTPATMSTGCSGQAQTVTVTVTAACTAASPATDSTSASLSSPTVHPRPVVITHVTATTLFVTESGLVTPKVQTFTSTEHKTATEVATVNIGGNDTTTMTADPLQGSATSVMSTSALTYFPNSTNPLTPYQTATSSFSTANFTMTVPPGSSTSQSDPINTIVTAAGMRTNVGFGALVVAVAAAAIFGPF